MLRKSYIVYPGIKGMPKAEAGQGQQKVILTLYLANTK